MRRLLLATRNAHKLEEVRRILENAGTPVELVDLDTAGITYDEAEEGLEPHDSFEKNAVSKARYYHFQSGLPTVADDSGLVVDALAGAPGVRSKRFAPDPTGGPPLVGLDRDLANNAYLLDLLDRLSANTRSARFVCAAVLVRADGDDAIAIRMFRGEAEGLIADQPAGDGGFGYDPVFFDPELGCTFGEIPPDEKHARSHRGKAFRALAEYLAEHLDDVYPGVGS